MFFLDSLDEYERDVVFGSCLLSSVTSTSGFLCVRALCAMRPDSVFRHLCVPGGTVRGQPPSLCDLLKVAAWSAASQRLAAAVVWQFV